MSPLVFIVLAGLAVLTGIVQWQWPRTIAAPSADEPAESLEQDPDLSIVYIVRERRMSARGLNFRVILDDRVLGGIRSGDYYVETVTPGMHSITIEFMRWMTTLEQSLWLSTTAGSTHFVKIDINFFGDPRPIIIDSMEGQKLASRCTKLVASED